MQFDYKDEYHAPHIGHKVDPIKILNDDKLLAEKEHGTTIEFYPDFTIMEKSP
jgi:DNA gyrase/topoisomerase IV subunit B